MGYLSNIEVEEVDLDLLHDQYVTLIVVQTRLGEDNEGGKNTKEIEHLEGLINFLEEIFEKNPKDTSRNPDDKLIDEDVDFCSKCGHFMSLYEQPDTKQYLLCSHCEYRDDTYGFDPAEPEGEKNDNNN